MIATNFSTKRGDTWSGATVTVTENDVAMDLTDASILMQLKRDACDSSYVLELSTGSGITITNAADGQFTIDAVIIGLTPKNYVYDVQITLASGRIVTILEGTFTVEQDVSR